MQQAVRDGGDQVGIDETKTRKRGGKTLSSGRTAPLKPKSGLSGPPIPSFKRTSSAACAAETLQAHNRVWLQHYFDAKTLEIGFPSSIMLQIICASTRDSPMSSKNSCNLLG